MIIFQFLFVLFNLILLIFNRLGYRVKNGTVLFSYWNAGMGFKTETLKVLEADAKTFKSLKSDLDYGVDKSHAFYKGVLIEDSTSESFTALKGGFSKDVNSVFYLYRKFSDVDVESFRVIENGPFSYDINNIYFYWIPTGATNINTFEVINSRGAKDDRFYYEAVFAGDMNANFRLFVNKFPIKDKESFHHLNYDYSKDKYQIYFEGEVVEGVDVNSFISTTYSRGEDSKYKYYGKEKISDPATFKRLSGEYAIDSNSVYYNRRKILDAMPDTFEIINQFWSKDAVNIYLEGIKADFLSLDSFEYIKGKYVRDEDHVYYKNNIVIGADVKTMVSLKQWDWIKDSSSYFYKGVEIKNIDFSSFQILLNDYSKDKNMVYFKLCPIPEIDVNSFVTNGYTQGGEDKFGLFIRGKKRIV